jgi:hypothetical protein
MDIQDFSQTTIRSTRRVNFSLTYKGIEVEGTLTESFSDLYSEWSQEVEIEDNPELGDADLEAIEDHVKNNTK